MGDDLIDKFLISLSTLFDFSKHKIVGQCLLYYVTGYEKKASTHIQFHDFS